MATACSPSATAPSMRISPSARTEIAACATPVTAVRTGTGAASNRGDLAEAAASEPQPLPGEKPQRCLGVPRFVSPRPQLLAEARKQSSALRESN